MKFLKLTGADRYVCDAAYNDVIVRGQIIEVAKDETAELLLQDTRVDSLNNVHPMFVEVSGPSKEEPEATAEDTGDDSKPIRARRTK